MATIYVSKEGGASDANDGLTTGTPKLTLGAAFAAAAARDSILLRGGDTWTENFPTFTAAKSGIVSNPTTFGSYGSGRAKVVAPDASTAAPMQFDSGATYYEFNDLDISNANFTEAGNASNPVAGEHIVEIAAGGTTHIIWKRVYLHHSANCLILSNNGPTPRSSAGSGTGSGDDSDWYFEDCEFYAAGNSLIIAHGSRWYYKRCHFHRWGESTYAPGKHGVYNHSPGSTYDACIFHNDEAQAGSFSGPSQGSPVSTRVTDVTIKDCILHDCNGLAVFWYDNVKGSNTFIRNRGWNLYSFVFYFDAGNDSSPAYTWGPNPVDQFVIAKNTFHVQSFDGQAVALQSSAAQYIGGILFADNVIIGPFTTAWETQPMLANVGVTGFIQETGNAWISTTTGDAGTFKHNGSSYTLAQWKTQVIGGITEGANSFYTATPSLGLAPAGDARRAPTPYSVKGTIQTPGDNTLASGSAGTYGAPDFFPQGGSPLIDVGVTPSNPAILWVAG